MTLASAPQIGATQGTLVTLASIDCGIIEPIPQPRMRYYPERKREKLTSRKTIAVGGAYIVWHWDFLKSEWRHALKDYWTSGTVSEEMCIESLVNEEDGSTGDDDWGQFTVIGTWPEGDENKDAGRRIGFDIEFEVIQDVTPA
jgi:hypothetical protein